MDIEKAFRGTLIKWQQLAAGAQRDPASDCGLCEWAKELIRFPSEHKCYHCPAWFHYQHLSCTDAVSAIGEAVSYWVLLAGSEEEAYLQLHAHKVVIELLAIKESLFKWAAKLEAQREE